jgi:SAM-dependent methyltransferase
MTKLNLGCGTDIRSGWINLDKTQLKGVDVVHDIECLPLPFETGQFEEILCNDVLEHVEYIPLLKELHRILKPRGSLTIKVPHFSSVDNYIDPTHKKMFSFRTFEYFIEGTAYQGAYYFDFHFSSMKTAYITFRKKYYIYNLLVEPVVNLCKATKIIYENTFLASMFPAHNIVVRLTK